MLLAICLTQMVREHVPIPCRVPAVHCIPPEFCEQALAVVMDPHMRFCDVDPPRGRARMAWMMAGLALASLAFAAVYYAFNVLTTLMKIK